VVQNTVAVEGRHKGRVDRGAKGTTISSVEQGIEARRGAQDHQRASKKGRGKGAERRPLEAVKGSGKLGGKTNLMEGDR